MADLANASVDEVPSPGVPANEPGLIDALHALWNDLRGLAHDHLELAALETQRAGQSLASIVVYGIVAGVLGVSAWIGLASAVVLWLTDRGMTASTALLLAALLNLAGALGFAIAIRIKSRYLRFPATLRSLSLRRESAAAARAAQQ